MVYRVEVTARAGRDLKALYRRIQAKDSMRAQIWFNGLEAAIFSLQDHPGRCPATPEEPGLRHLLYGTKPDIYRIIFSIDEPQHAAFVLHIRHGGRAPLDPNKTIQR